MSDVTSKISGIERRIREKASYEHEVAIREQINAMTAGCYLSGVRGGNRMTER